MNAWIVLDPKGRMLRIHQDGLDLRLQVGAEEVELTREARLDLARFLLSGVSTLEPVVEELAKRDHLFEPLPEPAEAEAPKPAHVSDGHAFYGRPADPINIEESVKLPPLKPKGMGRTVVLDDDHAEEKPAPKQAKPAEPAPADAEAATEAHLVARAHPAKPVKAGPSGP